MVYKKAALHLHGMSDPDRRWLLDRLAPRQRAALLAMLGELEALGIPRAPVDADDLLAGGLEKNREKKADRGAPAACIRELAGADPAEIAAVLDAQADSVSAVILTACHWPWRDAVIARFSAERRRSIRERAEVLEGRIAGKVREAVLKALHHRLVAPPEAFSHFQLPAVKADPSDFRNSDLRDDREPATTRKARKWWAAIRRFAWQQ